MKACVISGGGAYGAYHVGTLQQLNNKYDIVFGTSTGALQAPLVALGKYDRLVDAYLSITSKSIFSGLFGNPLKKDGSIKIIHSLFRILFGKKSLGDTKAFLKTIKSFYTLEDHNELVNSNKSAAVTVQLLNSIPKLIEHKSSHTYLYDNFIKYMYASASIPMIMPPVIIDNNEYVDGGTSESVSLLKALESGATEIDVFIHKERKTLTYIKPSKNIFDVLGRVYNATRDEVLYNDIDVNISNIKDNYKVEKINIYWMMNEYTSPIAFNKKEMKQMYEDGCNNYDNPYIKDTYIFDNKKTKFIKS